MSKPTRWLEIGVAAALTLACLALPTRNPSVDAWYYAACSRWGQELLQPHHLLYNVVGWAWLRAVGATSPAPAGTAALPWLQALNALAAGGCLLVLGPLLRRAGARPATVPAWLLLVGSCFGLLRFATENEAYVQPLLLALGASLAVARYWYLAADNGLPSAGNTSVQQAIHSQQPAAARHQPATSSLLLAGLLGALACLLHQLMVWWWLGLLLGLRPWRRPAWTAALAYVAPALLVPLAYALAAPGGPAHAISYLLHDYQSGAARVELGWHSLLLTPVGVVRTLVQVHGNLLPLLRHWPLPLGLLAAGCAALASYGAGGMYRASRPPAPAGGQRAPATSTLAASSLGSQPGSAASGAARHQVAARHLRRTHLLILVLHLAFAAQAAGNAEFMVMLPALAAVGLAGGVGRGWPASRVAALGLALLAWNVGVGLLPAHCLTYSDAGPSLRALARREPRAWLVLADPNQLRNQLHYYTGQPAAPRIVGVVGQDSTRFRHWLRGRLLAGDTVYTDALGGPHVLDRARLTLGDPGPRLLRGFAARPVGKLPTFLGAYYLSRLALPAGPSPRIARPNARANATVNTGAAK